MAFVAPQAIASGEALYREYGQWVEERLAGEFKRFGADVVHDAALAAWERMQCSAEIDMRPSPSSRALWLKKARDELLSHAVKEKRRAAIVDVRPLDEAGSREPGAEDEQLVGTHERPAADGRERELTTRLDGREQLYMKLCWQDDLPERQIARRLNLSLQETDTLASGFMAKATAFFTAKYSGQLCEQTALLLSVLLKRGAKGLADNKKLRLHMDGCERCAMLGAQIPRELRAAGASVALTAAATATTAHTVPAASGSGLAQFVSDLAVRVKVRTSQMSGASARVGAVVPTLPEGSGKVVVGAVAAAVIATGAATGNLHLPAKSPGAHHDTQTVMSAREAIAAVSVPAVGQPLAVSLPTDQGRAPASRDRVHLARAARLRRERAAARRRAALRRKHRLAAQRAASTLAIVPPTTSAPGYTPPAGSAGAQPAPAAPSHSSGGDRAASGQEVEHFTTGLAGG